MAAGEVPTLADVLSKILEAIQTILFEVSKAIAENAGVIATVIVIGGLAFMVWRYGEGVIRRVVGAFRGLI